MSIAEALIILPHVFSFPFPVPLLPPPYTASWDRLENMLPAPKFLHQVLILGKI